MAVPVVGKKQLHIAQLSPGVRKVLARRAKEAARREYEPVKAADRRAIGLVNQEYGTQARSAQAATGMVEGTISQALKHLQSSGLSGGYLRQAANELTARQGDAASSLPFLLADAGAERRKGMIEAKTQLLSDRAQQQKSSAEKLNSLLKEERGTASSYLESQEKARKQREKEAKEAGQRSKSEVKALANAGIALRDAISQWKQDPELREKHPLATTEDWLKLAHGLTKEYEGVSLADAVEVIKRLRARWKKNTSKAVHGIVLNPGTE